MVYRKKREPTPIKVHFGTTNHAFTDDVNKTVDNRLRVFDERRARVMDKIFQIIQNPASVLIEKNNELFIDHLINGEHYVVVLKYNPKVGLYEFLSAHFKKERQIQSIRLGQRYEKERYTYHNSSPTQKKTPPKK